MNKYRSHNCSELTDKDSEKIVSLSGWLHRKRDHGNLLFIDIRDHFGLTQCVIENNNKFFSVFRLFLLSPLNIFCSGRLIIQIAPVIGEDYRLFRLIRKRPHPRLLGLWKIYFIQVHPRIREAPGARYLEQGALPFRRDDSGTAILDRVPPRLWKSVDP